MASEIKQYTLCVLGCGNLGISILASLIGSPPEGDGVLPANKFIACVRSDASVDRVKEKFSSHLNRLKVVKENNVSAVRESDIVILSVDPVDVENTLRQCDLSDALKNKLLISVVAGWTRKKLETVLYGSETTATNMEDRCQIVRTLPNIAATVAESITAIETSDPPLQPHYVQITDSIFNRIGKTAYIDPKLMDAATAVGGSTPAFFSIICDALIDASVAVGVPRAVAQTMIFQAMRGTATLLQSGIHPGVLKDQGTSPEGCTIGGLMVLEEAGIRGHVGKALREAVTISRLMGNVAHVNDTRH
ncbi:proline dehydrogenase [Paecilomyces lecythidis]|uniref:Proline dehydrogenase n=1 Tax=Paecilomyces lecythidis TaxID=3004212 RepID=A0ABR3XV29_9EURO